LRDNGFSPTVEHRDLASPARDGVEGGPSGGGPQE
jgi:RNase adapter protein RapZ